jgi:hypothetical protein
MTGTLVHKRCFAAFGLGSVLALAAGMAARAQSAPQAYKGLEVQVAGIERATNVSLTDCPPGANTQRGVIKPGEATEFAAVKVDFKVTPAFKPGPLAKPVLTDASGKTYNTAQSFADVGGTPTFSCTFAFRVPKGTKVTRFGLENVSFDVSSMGK